MPSIFTRIISGEIPCHRIAEDNRFLAFLDIRPINPGHTLVIPKQEVDYYFDLDDDLMTGMSLFSKKVAKALREAIPCKRIGVMIYGLEVPHAHVHLVPIQGNKLGELSFMHAKPAKSDELETLASTIRSFFK